MFTAYARIFWNIVLLRSAPQDVPASPVLCWLLLAGTYTVGFIMGAFIFEPLKNAAFNAFDLGLLLVFLYVVLQYKKYSNRFLQTTTTVCGVFIIFSLLQLPIYWLLVTGYLPEQDPLFSIAQLCLLMLLVYFIVVFGHVLRHALSTSMLAGTMLALGYLVADFFIIDLIFPRTS